MKSCCVWVSRVAVVCLIGLRIYFLLWLATRKIMRIQRYRNFVLQSRAVVWVDVLSFNSPGPHCAGHFFFSAQTSCVGFFWCKMSIVFLVQKNCLVMFRVKTSNVVCSGVKPLWCKVPLV